MYTILKALDAAISRIFARSASEYPSEMDSFLARLAPPAGTVACMDAPRPQNRLSRVRAEEVDECPTMDADALAPIVERLRALGILSGR